MGRPVYPYEITDADFSWLISSFQESNPGYIAVENACLPYLLIRVGDVATLTAGFLPPAADMDGDEDFSTENK